MPTYRVTTWSHVEAPAMVLGGDGRPRYIWGIEVMVPPDPNAPYDWLMVTGPDGSHPVSPTGPAIVIERTDWEAIGMLVNGLGAKPVQS